MIDRDRELPNAPPLRRVKGCAIWFLGLVAIPLALLATDARAQTRRLPVVSQIEDAQGRRIGKTVEGADRFEVYDGQGRRLGYYDRRSNKTYDASGRIIARGNVATALIWEVR